MLIAIKLLHAVIWAFLAGCILVLPVSAVFRRFRWAAILTSVVLLECGVLGLNGGRCPLSDLAARFTDSHADNFDIYLPNWLASHNKNNLRNAVRCERIDSAVVLAGASAIIISQRRRHPVMQVLKAGVLYFALVFAVAFVLGTIRTLWVIPRVGTRTAELMEMPIMLALPCGGSLDSSAPVGADDVVCPT